MRSSGAGLRPSAENVPASPQIKVTASAPSAACAAGTGNQNTSQQGGGTLPRDDGRRAAVDQFVERLYKETKAAKPWVKGIEKNKAGENVVDGNIYVSMLEHLYIAERG